ncbi:MAG: thiamine pyrophosphate-dependent dehydrogenase E1 component subunit alpha [Firmicutes bacterium]|nr:thiamine pyrophosphate-dependent dehydrogenase E1 component subunit alpha [Bacillota bacterium]
MDNRHAALGLSDADVLAMYEKILLTRMVDERTWILNRMGRAPFLVSAQGQEACQVGAAWALRPGIDWALPYYRDLGVVLTLGMTAKDYMLGLLAKAEDPSSGGRQMPSHWSFPPLKIFTGSSPVATQLPQAAGIAYAIRLRGEDAVVYVSFGEGSASKGDAHEAMNFAAVHRLPVIFFCENNRYAISVPQEKQMAVDNVADRAAGYGFPGVTVDGMDPLEVYRVMREAVDRAKSGQGPTLIEAKVYRLAPHSSDDDDRAYRPQEEVEEWRARDGLPRFRRYLMELGLLTEETDRRLREQLAAEVDAAVEYAEKAPDPVPADLLRHVYGQ